MCTTTRSTPQFAGRSSQFGDVSCVQPSNQPPVICPYLFSITLKTSLCLCFNTASYQGRPPGHRHVLTQKDIAPLVALALEEDIGGGDITAALVGEAESATATVITREAGVLCGTQFVDAVFHAVDPTLSVRWSRRDGDAIAKRGLVFRIRQGPQHSHRRARRPQLLADAIRHGHLHRQSCETD